MANEYHISAGLVPIDNSTGDDINEYYISAGLVPDDEAAPTGAIMNQLQKSNLGADLFNGTLL